MYICRNKKACAHCAHTHSHVHYAYVLIGRVFVAGRVTARARIAYASAHAILHLYIEYCL